MNKEKEEVLTRVRQILAEHFEHGFVICSWEDSADTYQMHTRWGNSYAIEKLCEKSTDIIFPDDEEEETEEEEA